MGISRTRSRASDNVRGPAYGQIRLHVHALPESPHTVTCGSQTINRDPSICSMDFNNPYRTYLMHEAIRSRKDVGLGSLDVDLNESRHREPREESLQPN